MVVGLLFPRPPVTRIPLIEPSSNALLILVLGSGTETGRKSVGFDWTE